MSEERFQLGRVLQLRERQQDEARLALAIADTALAAVREERRLLDEQTSQAGLDLAHRARLGIHAADYRMANLAIEASLAASRDASRREALAETRCGEAREGLLAARTRVRALEKLRDRRLRTLREERARRVQRDFDEIAALRALRTEELLR